MNAGFATCRAHAVNVLRKLDAQSKADVAWIDDWALLAVRTYRQDGELE